MQESANDRSSYQREYYEKNKEELSKKRKERYRSNEEVRSRAKEASKRYREKKKAEREKMIAEGLIDVSKKSSPRRPATVIVGGKRKRAYTITTLAKRIGRPADTVNSWINIGTIPKTPFRSKRGDRLYTDGMILIVKMVCQPLKRIGRDEDVYERIKEGWARCGVTAEE